MTILTYAQEQGYLRAAGFSASDAVIGSAIGMAESSLNTNAINYIPCVGVMQVNAKVHTQYTVAQLMDPAINASAAYSVYKSQGWAAWTTYTSGAYKKYLAAANSAAGTNVTADTSGNGGPLPSWVPGSSTVDPLSTLAGQVDNPKFWARILFVLVGIVMIAMGLLRISATPQNLKTAAKIAEVIPK